MKENNKLNPISVQSKEWIMKSLLNLLWKKSYNEITITEIAFHAQLARRTFYRNFTSKEDVLDLYIEKLFVEYAELLKKEKILKTHDIAKIYFTFWKKHIDFINVMEKNNLLYMILQKYNEHLPDLHKQFKDDYGKYKDNSILEYLLAFSAGGFWNMLIKWVKDGAKKTPDEMADIVTLMLTSEVLD
ncbi:TetR/AcrR family transcriptional regulator [Clostridium pasteurianum]|uniref:Transcriptional regulator n=1 Tax=Clostridium pasteurianum BC1 TaxID=86416 RepID=R4JXI5_CLOPA|nr:TetR/AcrR family transcriptional regulator [Clostridium pasteurianum]AGK95507.1 transcriptional regulator [Clostridium pasteurianum BC1]